MKWPVANTKIKREKTIKNWKMALKMSIFKILKNALEFYFILSYEPTIPKTMIPQQKMWAGCYRLLPPTQKRSEFGPWQSLSRDVLERDIFPHIQLITFYTPILGKGPQLVIHTTKYNIDSWVNIRIHFIKINNAEIRNMLE